MMFNATHAKLAAITLPGFALAACAMEATVAALPAANVIASVESQPVGTHNADAADDPAIWRNASDPKRSLVLGTDKKAGLYLYGLDGKVRDFAAAGKLNNVDVRDVTLGDGRTMVLAAASDRTDKAVPKIALFTIDPATQKLTSLGSQTFLPASHPAAEAYGFCLGAPIEAGEVARAYVITKNGEVTQSRLVEQNGRLTVQFVNAVKLGSQAEGCVVDDRTHTLFVGEEDVAIWRIPLISAKLEPSPFAKVGAADGLVADIEGIAIARHDGGGGDWLVASSQGDSAYAVFSIATGKPVGRFRIASGAIDGTSDTDGIEIDTRNFGPAFPHGLFVAQDGSNEGDTQNFKFVDWNRIVDALGRE